jgi:hypothetical protein
MTAATATVVRGGHVLTMGPAGDLAGGAVAFASGEVAAVGPFDEVERRFPDAEADVRVTCASDMFNHTNKEVSAHPHGGGVTMGGRSDYGLWRCSRR